MVTVVAIPVKDLRLAKQRLADVLSPEERRELALAMFDDVLKAAIDSDVGEVLVVSGDAEVSARAKVRGARVLEDFSNRGHTSAVAMAQAWARERNAEVFVTIPGDVPLVTSDEIARLGGAPPGAVFVPSRHGQGTNGVALAPPELMPLTFGEPSFQNHLARARSLGLEPSVLELPGLSLDVDEPEDLRALANQGVDSQAGRFVRGRA